MGVGLTGIIGKRGDSPITNMIPVLTQVLVTTQYRPGTPNFFAWTARDFCGWETANGLNRLNIRTGTFERYFATGKSNTLSSSSITAIVKDRDGITWIGTMHGLNRFDPDTKTFQSYLSDQHDPNSISGMRIRSLLVDKNNTLWVGTETSGLNRFDRASGTFVKYQHDPNNPSSIGGNTIWHLYEDQQQNI